MGFFDFLFGNKKKPQKEDSFSKTVDRTSNYNSFSNTNASNLVGMAEKVNFAVNSGNNSVALNAMVALYSIPQPQNGGGRVILDLPNEDLQCVGFAFARIALLLRGGDEDINSVAAENAYFCLAKAFIENNNKWALPAIFTILYKKKHLLNDKFISSWCNIAQKEVGMPIGMMLGGNPFTAPHLQDFRDQAIGFSSDVMYYILQEFFDINEMTFKVPTDMFLMTPSISQIQVFLGSNNGSFNAENGRKHFISVYKECEDTLSKY